MTTQALEPGDLISFLQPYNEKMYGPFAVAAYLNQEYIWFVPIFREMTDHLTLQRLCWTARHEVVRLPRESYTLSRQLLRAKLIAEVIHPLCDENDYLACVNNAWAMPDAD